jgi:hypothetical protein
LPALPMPHHVLSSNQMRDLGEYLRAYVAYVSANLGWGKALKFVLVWLAGMFLPLAARALVQLPEWMGMTWMMVRRFLAISSHLTECGNTTVRRLRAQFSQTKNSRGRGLCRYPGPSSRPVS